MRSKFNVSFKRAVAGISAFCVAVTYSAYGSSGYFSTVNAVDATLYGDFNCDGVVDQKDVSELTKYLKDPASVKATDEGLANADVFQAGIALDYYDVQAIIENLSGIRELRTNSLDNTRQVVVSGDADCDGDVDFDDVNALIKYFTDKEANPLTSEGLINADVFHRGITVDQYDVHAIVEYLAGLRTLDTNTIDNSKQPVIYGDADCDGDLDYDDTESLKKYLINKEENPLTPDGLNNADVFQRSITVDQNDLQAMYECLAGFTTLNTNTINNGKQPVIYGDADCDGDLDYDDTEALKKYFINPEENPLTPDGLDNADVFQRSITLDQNDLQAMYECLAGFTTLNTNTINNGKQPVIYGDVDCDGDLDYDDTEALKKYFINPEENPLTPDGLDNADVFQRSITLDQNDLQAMYECLAGFITLNTNTINNGKQPDIYGDADCDGDVDFDDIDALNNYLKDPEKHPLTRDGANNADVFQRGITLDYSDVQAILEKIAGIRELPASSLAPVTYSTVSQDAVSPGDFNCDNAVDISDAVLLNSYLNGTTEYKPSAQALKNANVFNPKSEELDLKDVAAITEYAAEKNTLPAEKLVTVDSEHLAGDFNCDNAVDIIDFSMLYKFVYGFSDYQPSDQGLINANVYKKDSTEVDEDDLQVFAEYFAEKNTLNSDKLVTADTEHLAGDFNCDNTVDIVDFSMLYKYVTGLSDYKPSKQGLINANVYKKDSTEVDSDDLQVLAEFFAEKNTLNSDKLVTEDTEHLTGDFNCDNTVDIVDFSMLYKYVTGLSDYKPSEQGLKNANVYKKDSTEVDADDLQVFAEYFAGKNEFNSDKLVTTDIEHLTGDFNCDNTVNITDLTMYFDYIYGYSDYQPSEQGLENINVYGKDITGADDDDLRALAEFLAGKTEFPAEEFAPSEFVPVHGDFNCDNQFNVLDVIMYHNYIENLSDYEPSEQGLKNANVSGSDTRLDYDDFLVMAKMLDPKAREVISFTDIKGDVNEDGKVNAEDLVYLRKVLLGSEKYKASCDVNSDGSFGTRDFVLLKMLIVNPAPAEE